MSQEICNENLRVAKCELRDRHGLDFDWAFVGQQKMLHDAMCANMTVLRRYASPELQKVIDEQLDGLKHHQTTLENLMGQLKLEEQRRYAGGGRRGDRNPSTGASQRQPAGNDRGFAEEFEYAEAAFTANVRLGEGQNGHPALGLQVDGRGDRVTVAQVKSGSAAEKAQIRPGDVILAINGRDVRSPDDLVKQISRLEPGDRVELTIDRSFAAERQIPLRGEEEDRRQTSGAGGQTNPAGSSRGGDDSFR